MFINYKEFSYEEFDQYNPITHENTDLNHSLARLNKRHIGIIESVSNLYKDATVLDIACANARWSFACLKAGASYVDAIEPRENMITTANEIFKKYNIDKMKYKFHRGSVFDVLPTLHTPYDIVLLMGFLGHTYKHPELFSLIKKTKSKFLIIDSGICAKKGMLCTVFRAKNKDGFAYVDSTSENDYTYSAVPSLHLIKDMLDFYNFEIVKEVDWLSIANTHGSFGIEDYAAGSRITLICKNNF